MTRLLVFALGLLPFNGDAQDPEIVVRKLFDDFWNGDRCGGRAGADGTGHHGPHSVLWRGGPYDQPRTGAGLAGAHGGPDARLHYTLDSLWTSGDTVLVLGMAAFTHDRAVDTPWGRAFPTGERVEYPVDMAFRVEAGRVREFWDRADKNRLRVTLRIP